MNFGVRWMGMAMVVSGKKDARLGTDGLGVAQMTIFSKIQNSIGFHLDRYSRHLEISAWLRVSKANV